MRVVGVSSGPRAVAGFDRMHGRDERIGVRSFYEGQEFLYELVKTLSAGQ